MYCIYTIQAKPSPFDGLDPANVHYNCATTPRLCDDGVTRDLVPTWERLDNALAAVKRYVAARPNHVLIPQDAQCAELARLNPDLTFVQVDVSSAFADDPTILLLP